MAANMQSMAGPGQMMQQQQPQIPAALAQHVANALRMTQQQLTNPTWQTAVPLPDRMSKVMQMISNVRLANQNTDIMQATNYGIGFEREMFSKMPTKENYDQAMTNKTNEFFRKRQQNEPALQQQLSQNAQAQAMMNMNLQQQMGRGMNPQAFQSMQQGMQPMNMQQQLFQQQRMQQQAQQQRQQQQQQQQQQGQQQRMQQQLPQQGQQLQQQQQAANGINMGMGMGMGGMGNMGGMGMNMNMNMANQAGRGMNPNQQMQNMANGQPRPGPANMAQMNPNDRARIMEMANKLMMQATEESKQNASLFVRSRMTPQQLQEFQAAGRDPTIFYYQQQAANAFRNNRQRAQQAAAQQQGQLQNQNQVQGQAPAMQQQHSQQAMQHQNMMGNAQANNNFSQFPPSMESIKDQQMNGMKAQEAGQVVVPASMTQGMNRGSQPMSQTMSNQQHPNQAARQPQQGPQQQGPNMQQRKMNQGGQPSQAQLQAQAQMTQMQSQQSNMGGNMGPGQSPGMGTLNTPVTRPGSGMNQMGVNQGMGQGNVQFGDQRFSQGMQRPNNQAYNAMLADLTPEQRQNISDISPEKVQEMTRRWQMGRSAQMNMAQQNMNQMGNRTPGQMGAQPNGNMAGQGPQGVQQSPQGPNMAQAQAQAMMDNMDIPENMLGQLATFVQLGPEIKKWRDLRHWINQNQTAVPPQIKNELGQWQRKQFQAALARRANGGQNMGMNQAQANAGGQMAMAQNGMQRAQPPQNMPAHLLQVSPQDLAQIRAQKPQFAGLTDDHLRTMVLAMKKNAWQQRQSMLAQNQVQGQNQAPVPQMGPNNMVAQQANMQLQPPMQANQNAQAQRNQNAANQAAPIQGQQQKGPDPNAANRNNNNKKPQAQPTPSPAQGAKNLKRPNSDDTDAPAANQKPKPTPGPGQKSLPQFSPEDIANMKPEQRAKFEQLRRAQMAAATQSTAAAQPSQTSQAAQPAQGAQAAQALQNNQANQAENLARLKSIGQEEQRAFLQQSMPDIPMNPQELHETAQRLQRMVGDMSKIGRGLSKWYSLTQDDHRARLFFRTRLRILKQFADGESMSVLKDTFSIHSSELDSARAMLESMAKDLARSVFGRNMVKGPGQQPQGAAQKPQAAQQGTPQTQQQSPQTAPLNAANLEKNSQALKAQKQAGKGFKVPTAPTTTQPPFSFAAPSPHGNPSYANSQDPPMELKIPPRKKSRVSQAATPSPQVSKASPPRPQSQSQETQQPRPAEPQKPVLTCKEPECEHVPIGYANEEALQKHIDEEHVKPREDPLKFAQESLALALGLEPDGTAKKDGTTIAAPPMVSTLSKQGRTTGVNTPDSSASMKRSASSQKDAKPAIKGDSKTNDAAAALSQDAWAKTTFDPKMVMSSLGLENGISSVIFDMNAFRALTPEWTPESRDEPSEPNSDISDGAQLDIDLNWQLPETFETDLLLDLDKTSLQGGPPIVVSNLDVPTMDPSLLFTSMQSEVPDWEEIRPDFSKPFELDASLYAMDYES